MNKETLINKLKEEEFVHVYEWRDEPNTIYEEHSHKGPVTIYILEGNVSFDIEGEKFELNEGERFDVPVGRKHSAIVGPNGCTFLVGEMIEGDS